MAGRVAGVSAPAFVERTTAVSPGYAPAFVSRDRGGESWSPGYEERAKTCVAGVSAPAFVERWNLVSPG